MLGRAEPHFSFAGLKTALRLRAEAAAPLSDRDVADLCAAFEDAVGDIVTDRVGRAMDLAEERLGAAGTPLPGRGGRRRRQQTHLGRAAGPVHGSRLHTRRAAGSAVHRQRRHDRLGRRRTAGARPHRSASTSPPARAGRSILRRRRDGRRRESVI